MKKNKMMRLASSLLVAVLLTSSVISGTFAKYVTSAEANDTARVAKWGLNVAVTAGDGFSQTYAKDTTDTLTVSITNTVEANEKVVAPGTTGTLGTLKVYGQSEVAARVSATVDVVLSDWLVDSDVYFPLNIAVDGTKVDIDELTTLAAIEAQIEDAIATKLLGTGFAKTTNSSGQSVYSQDYVVGHDFGTDATTDVAITWDWKFEVDNATDIKDTALGNAATPAKVKVDVQLKVEQID